MEIFSWPYSDAGGLAFWRVNLFLRYMPRLFSARQSHLICDRVIDIRYHFQQAISLLSLQSKLGTKRTLSQLLDQSEYEPGIPTNHHTNPEQAAPKEPPQTIDLSESLPSHSNILQTPCPNSHRLHVTIE